MIRFLLSYLIALFGAVILYALALASGLLSDAPLGQRSGLEIFATIVAPLAALVFGGVLGGLAHGFLESRLGKGGGSAGR